MKTTSVLDAHKIGKDQLDLLKRLSHAAGVSGDEGEVRAIILELVKPLADDVKVDALGNVIAFKAGKGEKRMRVMLDAHMDEIGMMVTQDDGNGLYQFTTVGSVDIRQLPGKPVLIGKDHTPAVIGARAIHLTTAAERKVKIPLDTLRLDIGLVPENSGKIKAGDYAVFATQFESNGFNIRGKALDDRLGVAILIELLKTPLDSIDLYAVFSTQEEIGGRGARVAAYSINPDLAIAVDSTPANDFPAEEGEENAMYNTRLGEGAAVYMMDRATISNPRLVQHFFQTAEKYGISYQRRQAYGGGTDAGAIHLQRGGIPSISVSVPGRHAHTAAGLAYISDWQATIDLIYAVLVDLKTDIFA